MTYANLTLTYNRKFAFSLFNSFFKG